MVKTSTWYYIMMDFGKGIFTSFMKEFSSLKAIIILEITQTFLNLIPSFCNGGLISEKFLHLKRIGFTQRGGGGRVVSKEICGTVHLPV